MKIFNISIIRFLSLPLFLYLTIDKYSQGLHYKSAFLGFLFIVGIFFSIKDFINYRNENTKLNKK